VTRPAHCLLFNPQQLQSNPDEGEVEKPLPLQPETALSSSGEAALLLNGGGPSAAPTTSTSTPPATAPSTAASGSGDESNARKRRLPRDRRKEGERLIAEVFEGGGQQAKSALQLDESHLSSGWKAITKYVPPFYS
jgi:hypothetical protein